MIFNQGVSTSREAPAILDKNSKLGEIALINATKLL